jgi:hypothetical protein
MEADVTPSASPEDIRRAATRRKVLAHWVPDVHSPEFAAEARRQSLLAAQSPEEAEIQAFIDSVYVWPDDDYSQ